MHRILVFAAMLTGLTTCQSKQSALEPLPSLPSDNTGNASPRINGPVGGGQNTRSTPAIDEGRPITFQTPRLPPGQIGGGDVMLDFADTDIREIVKQVLGGILKATYTIDPSVHGAATIQTSQPLRRDQLLPTLEALLAQNGATLIQTGTLYRVLPSASALAIPTMSDGTTAGVQIVSLRYASARDLEKVLTPFVGEGARILADPDHNAIIVTGSPGARAAIQGLISAFDVDVLAGQSYALFPVTSGDPAKVAAEMQKVFQTEGGSGSAGMLRVIPMDRVNAVMVVSPQPRYIEDAKRLFRLVDRARSETERSWHVYYVQNGQSRDLANLLQRAFTPSAVTAQPEAPGATAPGLAPAQLNSGSAGFMGGATGGGAAGLGGGSFGANEPGAPIGNPGIGGNASGGLSANMQSGGQQGTAISDQGSQPMEESLSNVGGETDTNKGIRILPNRTNNAILIYATPAEESTIEAMLHKVDILPLQVRIDATIAEVTLTDDLKYGTQFFFKGGGIEGLLSDAAGATQSNLTGLSPGFTLNRIGKAGNAQIVLSALAAVTEVRVLSSPQVIVLDNQPARLQVGNLVPYLTQSSQSTLTNNALIVNSVDYRETGVILDVVPRVNTGGLVSLDIAQEVSDVQTTSSSTINSPTFFERRIRSRIVVQDGQTIGLAGLIRDNVSRDNTGIPYLKDIPILGSLFGTQTNTRQRTELLVLITPHVLENQRDAQALTQDLREKLFNAGLVPQQIPALPLSGSPNPNANLSR